MLETLRSIDWDGMNAGHLPDWIMALTSPDEDIQYRVGIQWQDYVQTYTESVEEWYEVLETDALILAIPFLIELIAHPLTNKWLIFQILKTVGYYHLDDMVEPYLGRAIQIHKRLLAHFDLYPSFLDDRDDGTRIAVIGLLNTFEEKYEFVTDLILKRLESRAEPDELVKMVAAEIIYWKIEKHQDISSQFKPRFLHLLQIWVSSGDEPIAVKAQAADYLIRLLGSSVNPVVFDILVTAFTPPIDDMVDTDVVRTLLSLGGDLAIQTFLRIFDLQTDPYYLFKVAGALLGLSFQNRWLENIDVTTTPPDSKTDRIKVKVAPYSDEALTEQQKLVLQHFVDKPEIWEVETNLFDVFGLPEYRFALKRLIAK